MFAPSTLKQSGLKHTFPMSSPKAVSASRPAGEVRVLCRQPAQPYPAGLRLSSMPAPWWQRLPQPRPPTSSETRPNNISPSLCMGGCLLEPHSLGTMGGRQDSDLDLWGPPSLGNSWTGQQNEAPTPPRLSHSQSGSRERMLVRGQDSMDLRPLSVSQYDAFYSGLDASATPGSPIQSILRSDLLRSEAHQARPRFSSAARVGGAALGSGCWWVPHHTFVAQYMKLGSGDVYHCGRLESMHGHLEVKRSGIC
jgi:hypothetical protein